MIENLFEGFGVFIHAKLTSGLYEPPRLFGYQ